MTRSPTRPPSPAARHPARASLMHFLRYGWPLLLIVFSGVVAATVVLDQTVFAH